MLTCEQVFTWSTLSPSWLAFVYCISLSFCSRFLLLWEKCLSLLPGFHSPALQFKFKKEAPESFYYFLGRTLIGPVWGMYPPALPEWLAVWVSGKGKGGKIKAVLCGGRVFLFVCNFICLFTFGCAGCSLLCRFSCGDRGLLFSYRARVSHCNGFSLFPRAPLQHVGSSRPRDRTTAPAWAGRSFITEPQGKSGGRRVFRLVGSFMHREITHRKKVYGCGPNYFMSSGVMVCLFASSHLLVFSQTFLKERY